MKSAASPTQHMPPSALPEAMRLALSGAPAPDCAHGFPRAWWRHLGASGLLDRVDALCFAAPVFFHSVRWTFL